ncbi:hypothetical protein AX774_g7026 [Zancudomyces culisetae]|uniref:Uncharacterized protein n=1 Tax=Zancudomyces culisetae TaxID=1213189 RepID=A0A1R1PF10_ZANCU|nr:hypothetical protein AX774_g7026 [Zancudomyces culisetae]|eukprot:OMH79551.1 hypothetical protein AX774_g7026 [Zancudomyces culisetae]
MPQAKRPRPKYGCNKCPNRFCYYKLCFYALVQFSYAINCHPYCFIYQRICIIVGQLINNQLPAKILLFITSAFFN